MNSLGVGVIGMGWMGHTHSRAYRQLRDRFPELDTEVRLVCCADAVPERAREGAARHGFEGYTTDWLFSDRERPDRGGECDHTQWQP